MEFWALTWLSGLELTLLTREVGGSRLGEIPIRKGGKRAKLTLRRSLFKFTRLLKITMTYI